MSLNEGTVKERIITVLSSAGKALSSLELQKALNIRGGLLARALFNLYQEGKVERVYTSEFDPTRPFDTAYWRLTRKELKNQDVVLVLSIPEAMGALRAQLISKYSAIDLFDAYSHVVNAAESELKVACPIIDGFGLRPIVDRIRCTHGLKVRIIAELDKSRCLIGLPYVRNGRMEVLDALMSEEYAFGTLRKVVGIHLKMAIADNNVALVGSFNFSESHFLRNFDIGFLILSKPLIELLSGIFEDIWRSISCVQLS